MAEKPPENGDRVGVLKDTTCVRCRASHVSFMFYLFILQFAKAPNAQRLFSAFALPRTWPDAGRVVPRKQKKLR